jgi:hypothetical protein
MYDHCGVHRGFTVTECLGFVALVCTNLAFLRIVFLLLQEGDSGFLCFVFVLLLALLFALVGGGIGVLFGRRRFVAGAVTGIFVFSFAFIVTGLVFVAVAQSYSR